MIDSSPSSAESSFRELDEVFLQSQTRIWLGELLNTRLDEDVPLSDLLQDGEILFEVSKVVWDLLLTKCMELRHLKHRYGPFGSKKSSGRYRPYSNVDSFLKICKIMGLSGIDLFSPSDIVEKRDIRKVCICIRSLSKKTRSKQLSVPDFDMVSYSVTMPTDMVGVIRKSLESSQCTFSCSASYSSRQGSQTKVKQENSYAPSIRDDDSSSSEGSDEAESSYMGENSFSSGSKPEYADGINSDLENSPETRPASGRYTRTNVDASNINFTLENDGSFTGDSSCMDVGGNNYISDYLAFSDLMVQATEGSNSVVLDGENNMFDFFLNVDTRKATSEKRSFHNESQRVYSDDEDMEVSSTTSMSSVLGRLLNMEFDNQFDEDDSSSTNVGPSVSKEPRKHYRDSFVLSEHPKEEALDSQLHTGKCVVSSMKSPKVEPCGTRLGNLKIDVCPENRIMAVASEVEILGTASIQDFNNNDVLVVSDDADAQSSLVQTNLCQTMAENHPCMPFEDMNTAQEDTLVACTIHHNISFKAENGSQDKKEQGQGRLAESNSNGRNDTTPCPPPCKHNRRPLLKTVAKGTAIAGVLFILLHISKSKGNNAQESIQTSKMSKHNRSQSSSTKQQTRREGNGRYPTKNIRFGN